MWFGCRSSRQKSGLNISPWQRREPNTCHSVWCVLSQRLCIHPRILSICFLSASRPQLSHRWETRRCKRAIMFSESCWLARVVACCLRYNVDRLSHVIWLLRSCPSCSPNLPDLWSRCCSRPTPFRARVVPMLQLGQLGIRGPQKDSPTTMS